MENRVSSETEHDVDFGARWAGLNIWETADLFGFSHTTVSEDEPKKKKKVH